MVIQDFCKLKPCSLPYSGLADLRLLNFMKLTPSFPSPTLFAPLSRCAPLELSPSLPPSLCSYSSLLSFRLCYVLLQNRAQISVGAVELAGWDVAALSMLPKLKIPNPEDQNWKF